MKNKKNNDSLGIKIVAVTAYAVVMTALTIALVPLARLLSSENGMEKFYEILRSYKAFGIVVFLLVQAVQVVVVMIPPVQIVGGMLFGPIIGSILSIVGLWIGSAVVFFVVKKFGSPLVEVIVSRKNIKKFRLFENTERLTLVFFVLYLIPGTPKDAMTYIVPLSRLDMKKFLFSVLPARIPSVVLSAVLGGSIYNGNRILAVVVAVAIILMALFGIFFREKILVFLKKHMHASENSKK